VNATASTDYQSKGVGEVRAVPVTAKATGSIAGGKECWTFPGSQAAAGRRQSKAEQERGYLAARSGEERAYKAGRLKTPGAGRESERPYQRRRAREQARGKGPCLDHAGEEVSVRAWWKRTTPPRKKHDNSNASYRCVPRGVRHGACMRCTT
jgi:hypothetical protein